MTDTMTTPPLTGAALNRSLALPAMTTALQDHAKVVVSFFKEIGLASEIEEPRGPFEFPIQSERYQELKLVDPCHPDLNLECDLRIQLRLEAADAEHPEPRIVFSEGVRIYGTGLNLPTSYSFLWDAHCSGLEVTTQEALNAWLTDALQVLNPLFVTNTLTRKLHQLQALLLEKTTP